MSHFKTGRRRTDVANRFVLNMIGALGLSFVSGVLLMGLLTHI